MKDAVYVTGNKNKAKYFNTMTGLKTQHVRLDVDEIQSLDLTEIISHKVRQAYEQVGSPVIVEDTRLTFHALGRLPGTYIKWFLDELGEEGLCKVLDGYTDRTATAGAAIAYYDGVTLKIYERSLLGSIVKKPVGDSGFGWNKIFLPKGADCTLGQMDEQEFRLWYAKVKPFDEMAQYLKEQS